jgi:hypothetical protein
MLAEIYHNHATMLLLDQTSPSKNPSPNVATAVRELKEALRIFELNPYDLKEKV